MVLGKIDGGWGIWRYLPAGTLSGTVIMDLLELDAHIYYLF